MLQLHQYHHQYHHQYQVENVLRLWCHHDMNLLWVLNRESTVNLPLEIQGGALAPSRTTTITFCSGTGYYCTTMRILTKLHTPFPIKKFEIRFSYLLEISPLQEMDKSLISPISPTSGLMSAPLRWNRTYQEHQDGE